MWADLINDILQVDIKDMDWMDLLRRYIILLVGLFVMSIGVNISINSNLGTTPISCIPNVLSFYLPLTVGIITIIFNALLVVLQILILRSRFVRIQVLQVFVGSFFGIFIDLTDPWLNIFTPHSYITQWLLCLLSCIVLAVGVYIEVSANALVLPGEGVSLAIMEVTDIEFGKIKVVVDSCNVIVGVTISLILFSTLKGVGLGTIFAMIAVGTFVRVYRRIIERFKNRFEVFS